jgi:hypothetical protein
VPKEQRIAKSRKKPTDSATKLEILKVVIPGAFGVIVVIISAIVGPILVTRITATPTSTPTPFLMPTPTPSSTQGEDSTQLLAAPLPVYPHCGSVIEMPSDGSYFSIQWGPVAGASMYTVEIDCFGCDQYPDTWYSLSDSSWHIKPGVGLRTMKAPMYSSKIHVKFRQEDGRALRWRVWAVDSVGNEGKKSDWCQLSFCGSY